MKAGWVEEVILIQGRALDSLEEYALQLIYLLLILIYYSHACGGEIEKL